MKNNFNKDKEKIVNIYSDGACSGNQNKENIGGYGAILEYGKAVKEIKEGFVNTTNNRMEISAVLNAFRCLKRHNLNVNVFSDSSYVVRCFREKWYRNWQRNGWMNSAKKPVENKDLWEKLICEIENNNVTFFLVKGHISIDHPNTDIDKHFQKFVSNNGDEFSRERFIEIVRMNNRADELANEAMNEVRQRGASKKV